MQKYFFLIFVSLITLVLPGCLAQPNTPINTKHPTQILLMPTQRPSPTAPQFTNTPTSSVKLECSNSITNLPANEITEGTIVIADNYSSETIKFIQNNSTTSLIEAGGAYVSEHSVSPNNFKLAVRQYDLQKNTNRLVIIDPDNVLIFPWKKDWLRLAGWFDNETLLIEKDVRNDTGYIANPVPLIVWNYLSEATSELPANYPGIYSLYPEIGRWINFKFSETIYNQSFEYVIYPKMTPYDSLVLWDVKEQQQITSVTGLVFYGVEPKWSADGTFFIVAKHPSNSSRYLPEFTNQQELFKVEKTGSVTQVTHLTEEYSEISFGQFSLSPDAKYIAFWLFSSINYPASDWTHSDKFPRLAILNLETQQITNYCIPGGFFGISNEGTPFFSAPNAPVWSPKSDEVIIQTPHEKGSMVIVINVQKATINQIFDSGFPVGWLDEKQ